MYQQVLDSLSCLLKQGYQYPSLRYSLILIGLDGVVKISKLPRSNTILQNILTTIIASLESTIPFTLDQNQFLSMNYLGFLVMELIQKYVKENVSIDNIARWPILSKVFNFLLSIILVRSMAELSGVSNKVPLLVNRLLINLSIYLL